MKTKRFTLHFSDLTKVAQHYFCVHFKTTPEEEDSQPSPLTVVEREMEEEDIKDIQDGTI